MLIDPDAPGPFVHDQGPSWWGFRGLDAGVPGISDLVPNMTCTLHLALAPLANTNAKRGVLTCFSQRHAVLDDDAMIGES
jgi:hypothetical protein